MEALVPSPTARVLEGHIPSCPHLLGPLPGLLALVPHMQDTGIFPCC